MDKYCPHLNDAKALVGRRVQIVNVSVKSYEPFNLRASFGIIKNFRCKEEVSGLCLINVAIKIVGTVLNPKSATGVFWLPPEDIELIDEVTENYFNTERNNIMEYHIAKVMHPATKESTYVTAFEKFEEGDTVVVDYKYGNNALSVRYVEAMYMSPPPSTHVSGVVIGKVNRELYDTIIDRRKKQKELIEKLRARATEREEEMMWRILAEHDPEMAKLLREYDEVR